MCRDDRRSPAHRFLIPALAAALLSLAAPARPALAQASGAMGHVEGTVSGPIVESAEAMEVTTQVICFCGGCANQTLHDCTCGLAAQERQKVASALAAGKTPDALITAYMAEHGPQIRIVPEKRGLNLIGWWVPFVAAAMALGSLVVVLRGWQRRSLAVVAAGRAKGPPEAERSYRDRLERDLREFDA